VFIDDNYRLITAIGVTAALVALSSRLEHGEFLAFVSLLMLALLDWELFTKIPAPQEASLRLIIFGLLSYMLLVYAGLYVFLFYLENLIWFLIPLFSVLLISALSKPKRFLHFLDKFPSIRKAQVLKYIIIFSWVFFLGLLIGGLIREVFLGLV